MMPSARHLVMALALALLCVALTYAAARIIIEPSIALQFAITVGAVLLVPFYNQVSKQDHNTTPETVDSYFISPLIAFALCFLVLQGLTQAAVTLGVAASATSGFGPEPSMELFGMPISYGAAIQVPMTYGVSLALCFWSGLWVGRRVKNYAFVTLLLIQLLLRTISTLRFYWIPSLWAGASLPRSPLIGLLVVLGSTLFMMPMMCVGLWRGRRTQRRSYAGYVVSLLPHKSQDAFIELACAEVGRREGAKQS